MPGPVGDVRHGRAARRRVSTVRGMVSRGFHSSILTNDPHGHPRAARQAEARALGNGGIGDALCGQHGVSSGRFLSGEAGARGRRPCSQARGGQSLTRIALGALALIPVEDVVAVPEQHVAEAGRIIVDGFQILDPVRLARNVGVDRHRQHLGRSAPSMWRRSMASLKRVRKYSDSWWCTAIMGMSLCSTV